MKEHFIRIADLAQFAGVSPDTVQRYIYKGIIVPDSQVKHGRSLQAIFLASRTKELVAAINRASSISETV
jgi:predicted site-specific integrase-resolvase